MTIKVMVDVGSLRGEREFQNEIAVFYHIHVSGPAHKASSLVHLLDAEAVIGVDAPDDAGLQPHALCLTTRLCCWASAP